VKLRIFPREESYFDLFDEVAANLADAARHLLDMVEDFVDPEMKADAPRGTGESDDSRRLGRS
jgi:hypothetical protein